MIPVLFIVATLALLLPVMQFVGAAPAPRGDLRYRLGLVAHNLASDIGGVGTLAPAPAATPGNPKDAPLPVNPFVRGSREHAEPFDDRSTQMTAAQIQISNIDVPAYGYLRHIFLLVTLSAGAGGAAVTREDAPWIVLANVQLLDVSGQPIVGPFSGYDLFLANKWGAYTFSTDPAASPLFSALDANGNGTFFLRVPVEIAGRDGLGALPNMASNATYKLGYTIAANTGVFSTIPAGAQPLVRVQAWAECWTQPPPTDLRGMTNTQSPPARGTTQYWSKSQFNVPAAEFRARLPRVGNLIRNLVCVLRTTAPARSTTNFPDPFRIELDGVILTNEGRNVRRQYMAERYGFALTSAFDTGVIVFDFTHDLDYHPGNEMRDLYLPTSDATRLELVGTFGAAGVLDVLVNDIKPAGDVFTPDH